MPRQSSSFFKRSTDIEEFISVLESKFGSVTRAWRVGLDRDDSGLLDFREFCAATKEIGYVGNTRTLWFNLDTDNSGTISLKELDPHAANALEKFRVLCNRKYKTIANAWELLLDQDKSGTVSLAEFEEAAAHLGYTDQQEVHDVFQYLRVRPGSSYISLHDIAFLQAWEETKNEAAFHKRLGKGWVNKDPYMNDEVARRSQIFSSKHTASISIPGGADDDEDYGEIVAVSAEEQKTAFQKFLVEKFGSLPKAFDVMDANGSGSLSMVEFQSVVSTVLRYCRPSDAARLFLSFNKDPGAAVTWDELGITNHEWINHMLDRRMRQRAKEAEELANKSAPLGTSPRMKRAYAGHAVRVREAKPRGDLSFGTPLPRGWGFPPSFDPRALLPLSARWASDVNKKK